MVSTFNYFQRLYLSGSGGGGLLLSNDTAETGSGQVYQQQTVTFTSASSRGSYGISASQAVDGHVCA